VEQYIANDPKLQHYIRGKEYEAYRRGYQDAVDGKPFAEPASPDPEIIDDDDDEPAAVLTMENILHDAKNDAQMSRAFSSFAMEDRRGAGKKGKQMARRKLRSNALPSEAFDPAELGQLPLPSFNAEVMKMEGEE
jgi:hypothetical protein